MGNDLFKRHREQSLEIVILFYKKGDKIGKDVFTFVSEDLKHGAHFIISAWEEIQKSNLFLSLGVLGYTFGTTIAEDDFETFYSCRT